MTQRKKNNIIIGSLCAVVLLMAVGYAAFQSVLNIKGTSTIGSNWNILITNVTSKNIVGSASNKEEPTWEALTATFKTNLVSPGDSIEYDITIENRGNLNAVLDKITLSDSNNPAIKFTSSGLEEGSELNAGSSAVLTVKVEYLASVTEQPESTEGTFTVTLDYSQKEGTSVTPNEPITPDDLITKVVTTGDGLYEDPTETGRYIYRGSSPSNYITFNDETWRIISIESDGTLKIVRNNSVGARAFEEANVRTAAYCNYNVRGCNVWGSNKTMLNSAGENITTMPTQIGGSALSLPSEESQISIYLNNDYYNTLTQLSKSQINKHLWNVGLLAYQSGQTLTTDLAQEAAYKWRGNIGLINATDYIKASTNTECTSVYSGSYKDSGFPCKNNNYLFKNDNYWTMAPQSHSSSPVAWSVGELGRIDYFYVDHNYNIYPTLYLISNIKLSGEGTRNNPYTIN